MAFLVWFLSALMCLAGIGGMIYGVDMLPTERGLAATIASSVALTGAFVTLAIGCVVHKLGKIDTALAWPPEFVAEASAKAKDGKSPEAILAAPKADKPAATEAKPAQGLPLAAKPAEAQPSAHKDAEDKITDVLRDDPVALKPSSVEAKRPSVPMATFSELAAIQPIIAPAVIPATQVETPASAAEPEPQHTRIDFHIPEMPPGPVAEAAPPTQPVVSAPSAAAIAVLTETMRQAASRVHDLRENAATSETGEAARNILERLRPAGLVSEAAVAAPAKPAPAPVLPEQAPPVVAAERPVALINVPPVALQSSPRTPEPLPTLSPDTDNDPMSNFEAELERLMPLKPVKPRARLRKDRSEPLLAQATEMPTPPAGPVSSPFIQLNHPTEPEIPVYILREPDKLDRTPQKPLNGPAQDVAVVGAYESGGSRYTMYSDGSVMAETGGKSLRFTGLDKLREYMGRSARA